MGNPRLLLVFTAAVVLVVGVIVGLATGSWLFLIAALVVHGLASTLILMAIGKRLNEGDKPDPVTEARSDEVSAPGEGSGEDRAFGIPPP